jgi:phage/plasmid-like protein (TIGR03299 family)
MAQTLKLVDERVVCNNTLQVALRESGMAIRIKHTTNAKTRMDSALRLMSSVVGQAKDIKSKMERLANAKLTRESVNHILDRLFPPTKDEKANQTRRDNILVDVLGLYAQNDKNAFPSIAGTGYNLFNAVTEYADHFRTARGQGSEPQQVAMARAESAMFGSGEKLKTQALTVILEEIDPETINSGISYLDK